MAPVLLAVHYLCHLLPVAHLRLLGSYPPPVSGLTLSTCFFRLAVMLYYM